MLDSQGSISPFQTYGTAIRVQPQSELVPYRPYQPSYAPARAPSVWDTYRGMLAPIPEQTSPVQSAVTVLRHNGEGMAIAALLAFAERQFGTLDIRGKYPADGILAAVLAALAIKEAGKPEGYASDLRALSQSCSTVMMYRKVLGHGRDTEAKMSFGTDSPSASIPRNTATDTDPILEAARRAGF